MTAPVTKQEKACDNAGKITSAFVNTDTSVFEMRREMARTLALSSS